jgi:hypothetical protein
VVIGEWTHITCTYDGTTATLYVDDNTPVTANVLNAPVNTNKPLRIGAGRTERATPDYYFNGKIADVRIWPRELNSSEVEALYEKGIP